MFNFKTEFVSCLIIFNFSIKTLYDDGKFDFTLIHFTFILCGVFNPQHPDQGITKWGDYRIKPL